MALRMTGLMSGLDTESIIQELVSARRVKVDAQKKAQTSLNWKQDAWKELNTKLRNLQQKYLSNMRFSDAYTKKTTKVSNSNAVSVITGENAVDGVQSLKIKQLAKNGYLTGAEIKAAGEDGKQLTALSKLSDIEGFTGGEGTINIKTGGKSIDIQVSGDTTISDVLTQLKNAGLNASFDEKWQRFNISSKESGIANDFSITASDGVGASALKALGIQTDITKDAATWKEYEEYAGYFDPSGRDATLDKMRKMIDQDIASRTNSYLERYKSLQDAITTAQDNLEEKNKTIAEKEAALADITDPDQRSEAEAELAKLRQEAAEQEDNLTKYSNERAEIESYIDVSPDVNEEDGTVTYSATAKDKLQEEVEDRYFNKAAYAADVMANPGLVSGGATKTNGQDAIIELNDATYTNNTNTFEINGLTFTALSATDEEITVTTEQDTDGIYDMIKNFLKEYSALVNEMDKLYNADSTKGYEPLTDEEKESMSEKEIEKWEQKIKDSILRRDDNLSTVNSALQSIMSAGIEVNGKTMYLFDFGIETLGYFESADNEKHAYHIAGDPDDPYTMNSADKLKSMISNDPNTVISFFTQLSRNLYSKMEDLSKSVDGYRSYGSFYDDKKMKSDYDDYTTKIKELEAKLKAYEDSWYAKFSKMETALAKMQSNASAVTSLLGG